MREYSYIDIKKEYINNELFEFIYAFYWEQQNGKYIKKFDRFENTDYYLFVSPEDLEIAKENNYKIDKDLYTTINGKVCYKVDPLRKLNSEEFKIFRNKFQTTYESDVPALTRWLCTQKPKYSKLVKLCYHDIETIRESGNYSTIEDAQDPIGMICCYDSIEKDYVVFLYKDYDPKKIPKEIKIVRCKDEKDMLLTYCKYLKKRQPDYLVGWYSESFDDPYILNRMKYLKIDIKNISILDRVYYQKKEEVNQHRFSSYYISIGGVGIYDLASAAQRLWLGKYCGYGLGNMCKHYIKKDKIKIGDITEAYYNRVEDLVIYNYYDTLLTVELDEKLEIFKKFQSYQGVISINVNQTIIQSNNSNFYLWQHTDRVLLNSNMKEEESTFRGGIVLDTVPGIHINPSKFDFVSEYPTIIMTYNISPDTILLEKEEDCISMDNEFYFKRTPGIIPQVIEEMYEMRMVFKNNKNKDMTLAYKNLMNAIYGQFTAPYSRIYSKRCGEAITHQGRRLINELKSRIESKKGRIILGDTDSIVVTNIVDKEVLEIAKDTFEWIYFLDGVKTNTRLKLELEKKIDKLIIFGTKEKNIKKKYVEYTKGEDPEIKLVGLDAIKSDTQEISKNLQHDMIEYIIKSDLPQLSGLNEVLRTYRKTFDDFISKKIYLPVAIPAKINKDLDDYKVNSFAVKAIRNSQLGINVNERFYILMTTKGPISFKINEDLKDKDIKIDKNYMWERVEKKAKIFYELLGTSLINIYQGGLFNE